MKHAITFTVEDLKSLIAEKIWAAVPNIKTLLSMTLNIYNADTPSPTVDVVVTFEDSQ